jgi:hypothetical protein
LSGVVVRAVVARTYRGSNIRASRIYITAAVGARSQVVLLAGAGSPQAPSLGLGVPLSKTGDLLGYAKFMLNLSVTYLEWGLRTMST